MDKTTQNPQENSVPAAAPAAEVAELLALPPTATLKDVIARVNELASRASAKRDRGPSSKREMTEEDARRVVFGDCADIPHGKAAEKLGLSYGQVYSARGGFTFKKVYVEWHRANPSRSMAGPKSK